MSSSGSDSGDEDYVPSDCGSQPPSEVESDGDEEDSDACDNEAVKNGPKTKGKGKRGRRVSDEPSSDPPKEKEDTADLKQKSESLWSDFLKDVSSDGGSSKGDGVSETKPVKAEKKRVTEVFEFAGEKVTISKEVTEEVPSKKKKPPLRLDENIDDAFTGENNSVVEEIKDNNVNGSSSSKVPVGHVPKHPALGLSDKSRVIAKPSIRSGSSSLSSALDKLGKKNKLSTLEKSKLDWESYKSKEGISEEIVAHNKGKLGYLDKRDFLEKTDLKQYEIEKQMRNTLRRKL